MLHSLMRSLLLTLFCVLSFSPLHSEVLNQDETLQDVSIEVVDKALRVLIEPDAQFQLLADGFEWSEGPVWMDDDGGYLLFTDVPQNRLYRWDQRRGVRIWLQPSGYTGQTPDRVRRGQMGANGLAKDDSGRLVLCQHGDRRIAYLSSNNEYITIADRYKGKRFNSPNDLVRAQDGTLYFTDPPFGLKGGFENPEAELDFSGVFSVSPSGKVALVSKRFFRPNGIALSPDESKLYVGSKEADGPQFWVFEKQADGTFAEEKIFFDFTPLIQPGRSFSLDGMAVDIHGNLWATAPHGIVIIAPNGQHLGSIELPHRTGNCAFGGPNGDQLFITSDSRLIRVQTKTKGHGL